MSDQLWVRVSSQDVPPREGRALRVGDREIALFNLGDRFQAIDNRCPHRGGPLADGIVTGNAVVCPLHARKINLETGLVERPADDGGGVATYETQRDGAFVLIRIPAGATVPQPALVASGQGCETCLTGTESARPGQPT